MSFQSKIGPRLFICSPYQGDVEKNVKVAKWLCRHALDCGYSPFASHLLYPQILDDKLEEDREKGLSCSFAFLAVCDEVWVYHQNGISSGMRAEWEQAELWKKKITFVADHTDFSLLRLK